MTWQGHRWAWAPSPTGPHAGLRGVRPAASCRETEGPALSSRAPSTRLRYRRGCTQAPRPRVFMSQRPLLSEGRRPPPGGICSDLSEATTVRSRRAPQLCRESWSALCCTGLGGWGGTEGGRGVDKAVLEPARIRTPALCTPRSPSSSAEPIPRPGPRPRPTRLCKRLVKDHGPGCLSF